ncbi:unnamed protein product [Angiostrongylus costaricensis]|uniref:ANK_REP_REGION domain-containing protein n=1 Tax=Angiostrongylus costaricensis TaxID=334426 RepID=A0A0R3PDA8_ANGCS|nr:unnamed protein product [Angiostrongylus costaricensis]
MDKTGEMLSADEKTFTVQLKPASELEMDDDLCGNPDLATNDEYGEADKISGPMEDVWISKNCGDDLYLHCTYTCMRVLDKRLAHASKKDKKFLDILWQDANGNSALMLAAAENRILHVKEILRMACERGKLCQMLNFESTQQSLNLYHQLFSCSSSGGWSGIVEIYRVPEISD